MKKNRFGSIGAYQMAQMNTVCEIMCRDTMAELRKMKTSHETGNGKNGSNDVHRDRRKTIMRG